MENQTREKTVKFFSAQFDAFNFETQFGAAVAGVQSGKTFLGAHWAGRKMNEFPDKTGLIVAPINNILRAATLKKLFEVFPQLRAYYKEHKGEIVLPTGGTVFIRSADNPLGIEGISPHWFWLDEGGMCSILTWTVLRSRVSMTGGQGLITTTPYNMGWLYRDFFLKWRAKEDPSLSFFTWASTDNPRFSKDFYEAERRRLRPEEFARRFEGKFEKMTGLVYDLTSNHIIDPLDIQKCATARIIGVDWGFKNPSAVIVLYQYDNCWYVVDEWKKSERTTAEIIQVIQTKMTEHKTTDVYPDPAEPDRLEECRRAGLPVMEAIKDIEGGISFVQQLIREKRFFVINGCVETVNEASMYHYEPESDDEKESKEVPVKFNDHLMDAMRYAIYSYKPAQRIKNITTQQSPPVKPYFGDREVPF
jgi:phage terminase large subunit